MGEGGGEAGAGAGEGGGAGGPGVMSVWIDDLTRPVLVSPLALPRLLGLAPAEKVSLPPCPLSVYLCLCECV